MTSHHPLVTSVVLSLVAAGVVRGHPADPPGTVAIPYADAKPIFDALRDDLWPGEWRGKTEAERETAWQTWVSGRDAAIRARVAEGDDDSVVNILLFGSSFTTAPRPSESGLAALASRPREAMASLQPRIHDFIAAVSSPGADERMQFARDVIDRHGIDPATESGRERLRRYLEDRAERTSRANAARTSAALSDTGGQATDSVTLFRDRGLSSDASIFINLAVDRALAALRAEGVLRAGSVQRVAVIGPGLDVADKFGGYDFYAPQTIQPFAVIDSLIRLGLAAGAELEVTAFDLNPRVIRHLEAARARARAGGTYRLVLPRGLDRPWPDDLVAGWTRLGDRIGDEADDVPPPAAVGRVRARSVTVRPTVVLSTFPRDLNIVVQRIEPAPPDRFDLILTTNLLVYYDVFEQSLAAMNIARMLRPGGIFLTNDRVFELPGIPLGGVGYTDVRYMDMPGIGATGERIIWYQRQ
jgi:SAM-dependent methyltransferase